MASILGLGGVMLSLQTRSPPEGPQLLDAGGPPELIQRHDEAKRAAREYNERMRAMVAETKNKTTGDKLKDAASAWENFVKSHQDAGGDGR